MTTSTIATAPPANTLVASPPTLDDPKLLGPSSRLLSTYRTFVRPLTWLPRWAQRYGDPFVVPMLGGQDLVVTSKPRVIKQLMAVNPDHYRPFKFGSDNSPFGERSVVQLQGAAHRHRRKLLMPPFHGQRMRGFAEIMHHTALSTLVHASLQPEVPFRDVAQSITLDVILRTVFGAQTPEELEGFRSAVGELVDSVSPLLTALPILHRDLWGLSPYARYRRAIEHLHGLLQAQIDRTRRAGTGDDILSMLLEARHDDGSALDDEEIRSELSTLLFAGHETTATALCWAVDAIGRDPEVRCMLQHELRSLGLTFLPQSLTRLPYLEAVCKETLRHHPIALGIVRVFNAPVELAGHTFPEGTALMIDIPTLHHRADIYPDPQRFLPERFLGHKFSPSEYMPFGGGHRRCIGAAFAGFEMQVVLGTLLTAFDFELLRAQPPRVVRRNVTLAPHDGVPVRIRPRVRT